LAECTVYAERIEVLSGDCEFDCPFGALLVKSGMVKVEPDKCTVCLLCMVLCGPSSVNVVAGWRC